MEVLTIDSFKEKIFNFEETKEWKFKGSKPAIIDFYADWCGPCHQLSPILHSIAEQYAGRVDIYKIDTEATPELAALFDIRGVPSILFALAGEEEPIMSSGVIPEEAFHRAIKEIFKIDK